MDSLYHDILLHLLEHDPQMLVQAFNAPVEMKCYYALKKIQAIIQDDRLDDPACFNRIEAIVQALESIGADGGNRHDFG